MPKCTFCGKSMPESRSRMLVRNDGRVLWFCSSKCERNNKLGRQGKKVRWTETFRKEAGKAGKEAVQAPEKSGKKE